MSSFLRGSAGMFRPLKQFACLSEDNLRDLDSTLELLATPCGGVAEMLCGSLATACAVACLKSAQARALRTCASCDPCALAVMEDRSYEDREMRGSSFF